jgi:tetratricopeptide (TPR) repeat protein
VAVAYEKLGDIQKSLGNKKEALKYYESYNKLANELYKLYPANVNFKSIVISSYSKLGTFYYANGNKKNAKKYYTLCENLLAQLVNISPDNADFKKNLQWVRRKLSELE